MQSVGSPDIVLVGFEPESIRFRIVELARSDSGNLRDRTDWSSRMLPSRSEPGSLPIVYTEDRLWNPIVWTDSASGDCSDERDGSN